MQTAAAALLLTLLSGEDLVTRKAVSPELSHPTRATVVVFLSSRCPCSASHEEPLRKLATEFAGRGVSFVGVNSNADEEVDSARTHFARARLPFPVLRDEGSRLADAFGALKTPHAFVIRNTGEILFSGGIDDSADSARATKHFLHQALVSVAAGEKPEPTRARALGCLIKR